MRIAVSGSHRVGKSTLLDALEAMLPGYTVVDEPYHTMLEDGYLFSHPPSPEDFERQLEHAIATAAHSGENVLFDRCPADFLAYLLAHGQADLVGFEDRVTRCRPVMNQLDLVVYVPIERRVSFSRVDDVGGWRDEVDEILREILVHDSLGLDVVVLEVRGTLRARAKSVLQWIAQHT